MHLFFYEHASLFSKKIKTGDTLRAGAHPRARMLA
jgi:hypothetical protein